VASLVGSQLPDVELQATDGSSVNLGKLSGTSIVFCYPFTGRPGHPNPPGWDDIPSAHGSTPQVLAFSTLYHDFETFHVKVFGLSFLSPEWQKDFATRHALPFLLLSDETQLFSNALQLERFIAGSQTFLTRRSMIIDNGIIKHDVFPVVQAKQNAEDTLAVLRKRVWTE
jgi:peroxiredoxin